MLSAVHSREFIAVHVSGRNYEKKGFPIIALQPGRSNPEGQEGETRTEGYLLYQRPLVIILQRVLEWVQIVAPWAIRAPTSQAAAACMADWTSVLESNWF